MLLRRFRVKPRAGSFERKGFEGTYQECQGCNGFGEVPKSATEFNEKPYKTLAQGSGCLRCEGLGYVV